MSLLEVHNLSVRYGDHVILDGIDFSVEENQWLMIVGPNGAGKSTIVRVISQGVPYTGRVLYNGADVSTMKPTLRARKIGVLSQNHHVSYSFTVEEIVRLGRYSHSPSFFSQNTDRDNEAVQDALTVTGMLSHRTQSVLTLSGGELQRTFLAQVFAQEPNLLILDEPSNHLDICFQKVVFELIKEWVSQPGRAAISVVHDLSLARAYGSDFLLLNKGHVVDHGKADSVFTRKNLEMVYSVDVYAWMYLMLSQWVDKE